jgi:hypothetical protein
MTRRAVGVALLGLAVGQSVGRGQETTGRPAVPRPAVAAIVEAFHKYRIVGLGDAHGNRLGEAFQQALVTDPGFLAVVDDVLVESGNSRYQDLADRFVRGEEVAPAALRRIWLDTTQQQAASGDVPALFTAVRTLNASRPANRRLRILLGEPPVAWESLKTADDYKAWQDSPESSRDGFGAGLIRREVLAKNRRALALYGAGHFFRKVIDRSLTTILERAETKVFTIWSNAALELSSVQPDVSTWPVPSLTIIRGTPLGRAGLSAYLGPSAGDVPPQWLAPMEEQFDAVLYLGPLSTITLDRPTPWRCDDPAWPERVRRANLQRPGFGDRLKTQCTP